MAIDVERSPPSSDHEQLFLSQLDRIERIIAVTCFRHRLLPQDRDDAASFIKLRLIEQDYAIVRKFQGRSRFSTFITTVIQRLFLDYQAGRFGKWRPSAMARRLGPLAMRLEALLYRDNLSVDQAVEVLRTNLKVPETVPELLDLAARLPARVDRLGSPDGAPAAPAAGSDADTVLRREEAQCRAQRLESALERALAGLPAEDRVVFKLRYVDSLSVPAIARHLHLDQFQLYRRIELGHHRLRQELEAQGITAADVRELLEEIE